MLLYPQFECFWTIRNEELTPSFGGVWLPVSLRVETEDSSSEPTIKLYTEQIAISLVAGIVQVEYYFKPRNLSTSHTQMSHISKEDLPFLQILFFYLYFGMHSLNFQSVVTLSTANYQSKASYTPWN